VIYKIKQKHTRHTTINTVIKNGTKRSGIWAWSGLIGLRIGIGGGGGAIANAAMNLRVP